MKTGYNDAQDGIANMCRTSVAELVGMLNYPGPFGKEMLLTRELKNHLRHNAEFSEIAECDHEPVVKLFTPDANATWLFSELAADGDTLFGLCDLGHGCPELGYASLSEISALRGRFGLLVERDHHFRADRPLSVYADAARIRGRIVA